MKNKFQNNIIKGNHMENIVQTNGDSFYSENNEPDYTNDNGDVNLNCFF